MSDDYRAMMSEIGTAARAAAAELAYASSERKAAALQAAAAAVWARRDEILDANVLDLAYGTEKGLSPAMLDRLMLNETRLRGIVDALRQVAEQRDPVGRVLDQWTRPNGLHIQRVATPLGVVGVIYESRPNVTADAGALCLKAGNAVILRGGSESFHSSQALHACMVQGLAEAGLPEAAIPLIPPMGMVSSQFSVRPRCWVSPTGVSGASEKDDTESPSMSRGPSPAASSAPFSARAIHQWAVSCEYRS